MMVNQHGIRVGDRYIWEGHHVTVSAVNEHEALIVVLQTESGARWTKQQPTPFPDGFLKVYSAPPEYCESCLTQAPAMGMAYCDDCLDILPGGGAVNGR